MSSEKHTDVPSFDESARWPVRMVELCQSWSSTTGARERDRALSELWVLLNITLTRYLHFHVQPYGRIDPEDIRDIVSEKSVAFLRALEQETLVATSLHPAKVCSYLSTLARNGMIDWFRRQGRFREFSREPGPEWTCQRDSRSDGADRNIQHEEFVKAICECVAGLSSKAQLAWFLRSFYDMPSRKIAVHADVRMTPTAVDMMLSRTRKAIRDCLESKGFNADDVPSGTFVALWELLSKGRILARSEKK